jgi:hypothetical protein
MPPTQIGFFVFLIQAFQEALSHATDALYPWVLGMLGILLTLEMGRVAYGIGIKDEKAGPAWIGFGVRLIVLCALTTRWEYFFTTVTTLGVQLGLRAGGDRLTPANFLNPGAYIQLGLDLGQILFEQWNKSAIATVTDVLWSPGVTFFYFLAWLLFLLAFFLMGLIVFAKQIEMAFALPSLLVLLPFLAFGKTGWMGQGVVTYILKLAYTWFLLALIASIAYPITKEMALSQSPDIRQALLMMFAGLTVLACYLLGPKMAVNIFSGVFTLGAGSMANAALLTLQTATLMKTLIHEVTRRTVNTTGAVLSEATGGRVQLPTIPPPRVHPGQLTASLRNGARHLHD